MGKRYWLRARDSNRPGGARRAENRGFGYYLGIAWELKILAEGEGFEPPRAKGAQKKNRGFGYKLRIAWELKILADIKGETSNSLFKTLEDWNTHLKAENIDPWEPRP